MLKSAVLVSQLALAAGGEVVTTKEYSTAGCNQADLKKDETFAVGSFLLGLVFAFDGFGGFLMALDTCVNTTDEEDGSPLLSKKVVCKNGILAVDVYPGSDKCAEASHSADDSYVEDCRQVGEEPRWRSRTCQAEPAGWEVYWWSNYGEDQCVGYSSSFRDVFQTDACHPMGELRDGTWTSKSEKMIKSNGNITTLKYGTLDCTGDVTETEVTQCGGCKALFGDDKTLGITCGDPSATVVLTETYLEAGCSGAMVNSELKKATPECDMPREACETSDESGVTTYTKTTCSNSMPDNAESVTMKAFTTADCSAGKVYDGDMFMVMDDCYASGDVEDGAWQSKMLKSSWEGDTMVTKTYSGSACSGTPTKTDRLVCSGACTLHPESDSTYYMCEVKGADAAPTADAALPAAAPAAAAIAAAAAALLAAALH